MKKTVLVSSVSLCMALLSSCASTNYLKYRDAPGKSHVMKIDQDANPVKTQKDLWRIQDDVVYYDDPEYIVRMGVDVSRHDGLVDFEKVRESGRDFVILRCAYRGYVTGILHQDELFYQNLANALENGMDVGVYVFSQAVNETEALEEAELVIKMIRDHNITLPVVYDPENIPWEKARSDRISKEQWTKNAVAFCERVKEAGYVPMIYSNMIWEHKRFDMPQLKGYKFWYADYEENPQSPYDFEFWQYSDSGSVPGMEKKADLDIMIVRKNPNPPENQ